MSGQAASLANAALANAVARRGKARGSSSGRADARVTHHGAARLSAVRPVVAPLICLERLSRRAGHVGRWPRVRRTALLKAALAVRRCVAWRVAVTRVPADVTLGALVVVAERGVILR
jgi:hypothetical protein